MLPHLAVLTMAGQRRNSRSNYKANYVPHDWKCSECGKREGYLNLSTETCSDECARRRKSRLQREARHKQKQRKVVVKFVAGHTGS